VAEHGVQGLGNCSRASGGQQGQRFRRDCARAPLLADEFISVRLIDFVADAEAMADETLLVIAAVDVRFRPSLDVVDEHLVRALDAELKYRESKGYLIADADSPTSLEQFVERSGRLKKHFEAVLALDREAYPVDERLHIWLTCLAALIGGACAFVLQTYLVRWSSDRTVGWGLVGLTVLMGATYAMRDRIKEAFHRRWCLTRAVRGEQRAKTRVACNLEQPTKL
jgi:hypothetical protein